jgi:hypothetical protein
MLAKGRLMLVKPGKVCYETALFAGRGGSAKLDHPSSNIQPNRHF